MSLCDVVYFCVFVVSLERTFCLCGQWGHWMCFSFCWDSCTFPRLYAFLNNLLLLSFEPLLQS